MRKLLVLTSIILLIIACQQRSQIERAAQTITSESLMEPIEILSSDEFMGRATGTEGEEKTVNYLVDYFAETCVEPGMPDGSWMQEVPLTGQKTAQDAVIRITKNGDLIHRFDYYTDFMAWPANLDENVDIKNTELVYVGYGIQAPEENWDDFKGAEVKGKILVVKNNDPNREPELFEGETRLYYGRYDYKYEKARELGAAGVLIVHTTPSAGYGWNVVANSWSRERFYLSGNETMNNSPTKFNGWLTKKGSTALFKSAGLDLEEQLSTAENRDFEPVPLDGLRLSLELNATYSEKNATNVLGVIPGSDEQLRDEYLVFTAHHDHLGITKPVDGDSVNNGALDNASGVSALLNISRAYCSVKPQLKRSILFLIVGSEEVGLLGSQYWAEHPTVHPGKVTGNINLDALNVFGQTKDIVLTGYDRNTLSDVFDENAREEGRVVKPDPHPDRGYFYRSDHFSLAKKGIPAIYPNTGTEYTGKPEGYGAKIDSIRNSNYHTVNDEINEYWNLSGMVQDVRLFFEAGYEILNHPEMMKWREGNEFQETRQKMLEEAGSL